VTFMLSEPEHRFLFVHIPKTGGTSITLALDEYKHHWNEQDIEWWIKYKAECNPTVFRAINGGHARVQDYIAFMKAHSYPVPLKVYSIIRNTWDKVVSGYHYNQGNPPQMEFGPWLEWSYNMWKKDLVEGPMWHQHTFVDESEYPITFLCFEDGGPPAALDTISKELGLKIPQIKHIYKSVRKPYREYYSNQRYIDMVAEVFKKDIDMFGYEF